MSNIARHPSTDLMYRRAAKRLRILGDQHRQITTHMRLGMLISNFSLDELILLQDHLTYGDIALLKKCGFKLK